MMMMMMTIQYTLTEGQVVFCQRQYLQWTTRRVRRRGNVARWHL